jgi:hypothetical protein
MAGAAAREKIFLPTGEHGEPHDVTRRRFDGYK